MMNDYRLLAELFRGGPISELRSAMRAMPEFDAVITSNNLTDDDIAAAHHTMFGFNVFPYASVYLEEDGFLGKDVSESARVFYERSGVFEGDKQEEADHITTELLFCASLTDHPAVMAQFCDSHLLTWLPSFVFAIERRENVFYNHLARETLEFVIAHRKRLPRTTQMENNGLTEIFSRTTDTTPDDSNAIRHLADHFSSASRCGLFISRGDIADLARSLSIPTGFGGRLQMLRTLVELSETYSGEDDVAAGLKSLCQDEMANWQGIVENHPPEALVAASEQWIAKLRASQHLLLEISEP